jgi:hypothetical protein
VAMAFSSGRHSQTAVIEPPSRIVDASIGV